MIVRLNFLMKSEPTQVDLSSVLVPTTAQWDKSFEFSRTDFDFVMLKLVGQCASPYSTIDPSIKICTGSKLAGSKIDSPFYWRLRILVPFSVSVTNSNTREEFIEKYRLRLLKLNSQEGTIEHGFNLPHLNRPSSRQADQRNVVWIDTSSLVIFSYNKSAIRHITLHLRSYVEVIANRYNLKTGSFAEGSILDQMQYYFDEAILQMEEKAV